VVAVVVMEWNGMGGHVYQHQHQHPLRVISDTIEERMAMTMMMVDNLISVCRLSSLSVSSSVSSVTVAVAVATSSASTPQN